MENLLYLTLPFTIARAIQIKKAVAAEKIDNVTIYQRCGIHICSVLLSCMPK